MKAPVTSMIGMRLKIRRNYISSLFLLANYTLQEILTIKLFLYHIESQKQDKSSDIEPEPPFADRK